MGVDFPWTSFGGLVTKSAHWTPVPAAVVSAEALPII